MNELLSYLYKKNHFERILKIYLEFFHFFLNTYTFNGFSKECLEYKLFETSSL